MTKTELVEAMANDASITKTAADAALKSLLEGITDTLKNKNGKVTLVGFGTFEKIKRKARKGRNPQTGEEIIIQKRKMINFRPSKKLRQLINR